MNNANSRLNHETTQRRSRSSAGCHTFSTPDYSSLRPSVWRWARLAAVVPSMLLVSSISPLAATAGKGPGTQTNNIPARVDAKLARFPKFEPNQRIPAIDPVTNPPVVLDGQDKYVDPNELVLGVVLNNEARAYPLNMISGPEREVTNDQLGGKSILVTFCSLCADGAVFERTYGKRTLTFGVDGSLWKQTPVMYDQETRTSWSPFVGQAMAGELQGTELVRLPCQVMDWKTWKALYPKTSLLAFSRKTPNFNLEKRKQSTRYVLGVLSKDAARCYPFETLKTKSVVNDSFEGEELVVTLDLDSTSAAAFSRKVDGKVCQFRPKGKGLMEDIDTGSVWNVIKGECIEGKLKGRRLTLVASKITLGGAWILFYPKTEIYGDLKP